MSIFQNTRTPRNFSQWRYLGEDYRLVRTSPYNFTAASFYRPLPRIHEKIFFRSSTSTKFSPSRTTIRLLKVAHHSSAAPIEWRPSIWPRWLSHLVYTWSVVLLCVLDLDFAVISDEIFLSMSDGVNQHLSHVQLLSTMREIFLLESLPLSFLRIWWHWYQEVSYCVGLSVPR